MKERTPQRIFPKFLAAGVGLISILTLVSLRAQGSILEEGQFFPTFPLPLLGDGRPVSVEQFRGKKLVLHIFASW